jgi:PAS domain S-box-containing protein
VVEPLTSDFETLWNDGEFRLSRSAKAGSSCPVLLLTSAVDQPAPSSSARLEHAYDLRSELDPSWAARPLELIHDHGKPALLIEDHGGEVLARLLGKPWELDLFLRVAIGITAALERLHQRGLFHRDIKPANVYVNISTGQAWLSGFGLASRLPRERQTPEPPETLAGTLAYMAPEQTGRMNRSIDSRSDLYSLGVMLYQLLTGSLPFTAFNPMEWVHCHIARRPVPPNERLDNIPIAVSQIIMRLLAKTVEERYQTATGLECDLRRCLGEWKAHRHVVEFPLGQHDTPDRLLIPEKLYGREREIDALLAAFDRVVKGGAPELVLVSGYSGIGKSSVVNELHKVVAPPRGLFASGKFDRYKRDIPYSTLVQAFQSLVRPLLGKSDAELAIWRGAFLEALALNARLMTDLIPELKLIIGDQAPVPDLEPQQAQSRFQLVFRRFIGVFARPEHPLALFLDDLQWLDAATLDLLEDLLTRSDLRHLMLIGAYRDNEVDAAHPLMLKLKVMRKLEAIGAQQQEVRLAALAPDDLGQLIADALRSDPADAGPLVQLVHEKTAGNPFFVIQFLYSLAEEGLLSFDHDASRWSWDLDRIREKGYTDNVVDLMVDKLTRLPVETQQALQQLACLGNVAAIATLSNVLETPEERVHADLWPAVCQDLIERLEGSYKFTHDRVQEASYSMIPEALRAEVHLRIGRLLVAETPADKREEAIFEIVNQLNRSAGLIISQEERDQLAELNLLAGKRAKGATAYASALTYLMAGGALLKDDCWERRRELIFALELNRAECEFLTGQLSAAEERLAALSNRATTIVESAIVSCLRMDVSTTLNLSGRAVAFCLDYLRHVGIEWSPHPTEEEMRREYERIWSLLGNRTIEDLIDLPLMEDPASLATVDVLIKVLPPAKQTDENLAALTICKAVSLSIEHGNCDASCVAYEWLARIAGPHFGDYQAGFRFGHVGFELVERRGLKRYQASTQHCFAIFVVRWTKHVRACVEMLRRTFELANRIGDLTYAAYVCHNLNSDLLFAGETLPQVQAEAKHGLEFAEKMRFGLVIDIITTQLAFVRTLRGFTPKFGCFDDAQFNESSIEFDLSSGQRLATIACRYWIRKLQARCIAGDYATAIDAASQAQPLLWTVSALFEEADYHFYGALAQAACCDSAPAGERLQHRNAVAAHRKQLQVWAEHCPENFENRVALVDAELARIEGRVLDAEQLYEQAIHSAQANGFVHNEALADELAARFAAARGFKDIAHLYLRKARYGYLRWGADGKVRQLEEMYPHLRAEEPPPGPTSTIATPVEQLDLATVIKVSQAVSSEIVLEKLIHTVMRTAIEQAGAERGLLILARGGEQRIAAEATTSGDTVNVEPRDMPVGEALLPESLVRYVIRTHENVILDDALARNPVSVDPYIVQQRARSILCLPLINQAKLSGLLYLENNLTPHVFTPERITVLKVLASQAAISLENSRLYRDLANREGKIRRLVDANILGICLWSLEGVIVGANEAFLRLVQYGREDLVASRVRWTDLTPAEWRERAERALAELNSTGTFQPFETEYFRKNGSRVPVLIGGALFEEGGNEGVAFVLDLSEQKRAEESLRSSEAELLQAQRISHTGSWKHDLASGTVIITPEVIRIFDIQPEEDGSKAEFFFSRIHPEDRPGEASNYERAALSKADFETDYRIVLLDGSVRHVHNIGHPKLNEAGDLVEFVGTVIDVTAAKEAEKKIRQSEREARQLLDLSPLHITLLGPDGDRIYNNHAALDYFGLTLEAWQGSDTHSLIHPQDAELGVFEVPRKFLEGAPFEVEMRLRRRDGQYRWFQYRFSPMLDEHGCITRWYGAGTDIDDRKVAEQRLQDENVSLREEIDRASMFEEIVGTSEALKKVVSRISRVAPTESGVLITGETGTGKELVARAIHRRSRRSKYPFVSVNCAAIPRDLIASELFGHEKGAFTGATQRRSGRFELAAGGTIFLDEVGDLPVETQVSLLRVLQEREFERVGGSGSIQTDVRVLAATNRDLESAIATGTFRSDLFYRLNVFPIEMPPLRERREDIPLLVEYFLERYARKAGKTFKAVDRKSLDLLQSYPWPGNIRELQNVIERSVIVNETETFSVDKSWLYRQPRAQQQQSHPQLSKMPVSKEKELIEAVLRECGGRVSGSAGAAAKLGIPGSTLESKIKSLKIDKNRFRGTA